MRQNQGLIKKKRRRSSRHHHHRHHHRHHYRHVADLTNPRTGRRCLRRRVGVAVGGSGPRRLPRRPSRPPITTGTSSRPRRALTLHAWARWRWVGLTKQMQERNGGWDHNEAKSQSSDIERTNHGAATYLAPKLPCPSPPPAHKTQ